MRAAIPALLLLLLSLPVRPGRGEEPPAGMVRVPAGEFVMGADDGGADETPAHRVFVSAFDIDRCEVTVGEFAAWVRDGSAFDDVKGPWFRHSLEGCLDMLAHYARRYGVGRPADLAQPGDESARAAWTRDQTRWRAAEAALRGLLPAGADASTPAGALSRVPAVRDRIQAQASLPVRDVTWHDAAAFARAHGKRLPTEAEWEKAARGTDRRPWPWGNEWDARRCCALRPVEDGPEPVGLHPDGASPSGCLDMAGNVWEWVADWYGETAYASHRDARDPRGPAGLADGRLPAADPSIDLLRTPQQGRESDTRKIVRGGGFSAPARLAPFQTRCSRRLWNNPDSAHPDVGFRCAKDAP